MTRQFEVKRIHPPDTRPLRHLVLWPHKQTVEECTIPEDLSDGAIHLGTFDNSRLVSIGSLFRVNSPKLAITKQYRLRAMATHPDYAGRGAGRVLVLEAIRLLKKQGEEVLWCDARMNAIGFYSQLGFQLVEGVYEVPLIGPHQFMYYNL